MKNYWAIPNNIISLKKLYYITKFVQEHEFNEQTIHSELVRLLNENHLAERVEINTHPRSYAGFYKMIFKNGNGIYQISELGQDFLVAYENLDQPKILEILITQLFDISFPNDYTQVLNTFQIRPFRFLFALLLDTDITYLSEYEISHIVSFAQTDRDLEKTKQSILKNRSQPQELKEGMRQVEKIFNLYCRHFKILQKQHDQYFLTEEAIPIVKHLFLKEQEEQDLWIFHLNEARKEEYDPREISKNVLKRNSKLVKAFQKKVFYHLPCECAVCKLQQPNLLQAVYIKPANEITHIEEAKDWQNGMILCPNHAALFEHGSYISFDEKGKLKVQYLTESEQHILGLKKRIRLHPSYLTEKRKKYLNYHNQLFDQIKNK